MAKYGTNCDHCPWGQLRQNGWLLLLIAIPGWYPSIWKQELGWWEDVILAKLT